MNEQRLVRALLREQHPDLADLELRDVDGGWDNRMWRLGDDLAVRLPRSECAPALLRTEEKWLPVVAGGLSLPTPMPVRIGEPSGLFEHTWTVTRWVEGDPADRAPITDAGAADVLAEFLRGLHAPAPDGAPVSPTRGIPLSRLGVCTDGWFEIIGDAGCTEASRKIWQRAVESPDWVGAPLWLHGDLHPANVVSRDGQLVGVVDFGDMCSGDPATDLAAAWVLLPDHADEQFFEAYGFVDDATVARGARVGRAANDRPDRDRPQRSARPARRQAHLGTSWTGSAHPSPGLGPSMNVRVVDRTIRRNLEMVVATTGRLSRKRQLCAHRLYTFRPVCRHRRTRGIIPLIRKSIVCVVGVAALVAVAGCGSGDTEATGSTALSEVATTTLPADVTDAPSTSAAPETTETTEADDAGADTAEPEGEAPKCTAADITPELADPSGASPSGQVLLQLLYTNSGAAPCFVQGLPGATLKGEPNPKFGPEYQLARSDATKYSKIILTPGKTAAADITLGTVPLDDPRGWQATELLTIPAGDTEVMTLPFPKDLPVLRDDAATRPATYIEAFTGPLS